MRVNYRDALDCLKRGGVLLLPTDTGWCLAVDARSEEAGQRLNALVPRGQADARTVLIAEVGQLTQYVTRVPDVAWDWVEFSEKPLTVIYPNGKNLAPGALAANGDVAIRLLKDEFSRGLVHRFGRAILTAPVGADEAHRSAADGVLSSPAAPKFAPFGPLVRLGVDGEVEFLRKQ